jgi:hypothetical protein
MFHLDPFETISSIILNQSNQKQFNFNSSYQILTFQWSLSWINFGNFFLCDY